MNGEAPELLSEKHRTKFGISRSMWYQLLHRDDLPIVVIGERRFLHRDLFMKWLEEQANNSSEKGA